MPITPAEVRAVQFATTRMRSGYDMDEVDAFLDIIEADVAQYADELQRVRDGEAVLRAQCDQLQSRIVAAERRISELDAQVASDHGTQASPVSHAERPEEITAELQAALAQNADASAVMAVAQRTADEIIRSAESQAEAIRARIRLTLDEQRRVLDQT
jgi:DivIVA domain-containing protein